MIRKNNRLFRATSVIIISTWMLVSFAALAAMYFLFWQRERVLYLGKSVEQQRVQVWKNAGLPVKLLNVVEKVDRSWPNDVNYSFSGQHNKRSYVEYLLIPRVPSGSSIYKLDTDGSFEPGRVTTFETASSEQNRGIYGVFGLVLSFCSMSGLAICLQAFLYRYSFSFPELFSLSCLCVFIVGTMAKIQFQSVGPGFVFIAVLGLAGLLFRMYLFLQCCMKADMLPNVLHSYNCDKSKLLKIFIISMFLAILLSLIWSFLMAVVVVPDDWDAWAIWGAKAKLLLLGSGPIGDVTFFGHADYPLLWPMIWAYSSWWSGGWEETWSKGWSSIFYGMVLWELAIIVYRSNADRKTTLIASALFATVPMTPLVVSWSYAEAPLWLFMISSLGCLYTWRDADKIVYLVIGALLGVGAVYTKNDGILFLLIIFVWLFVIGGRGRFYHLLIFSIIILFCYAPWLYWIKVTLQLGSHATDGLVFGIGEISRATERLPKALRSILAMWLDIKQWGAAFYLSIVVFLYTMVKGYRRFDLIIPILMFFGYLIIIVFHRSDIYWQVGTVWNRLTLQILPILLVVSFTQLKKKES